MQCVSLFLGRVRGEGVRGFGGSRVQVCGTRDALEVALGERLLGVTCPDTINLTVDPPLPAPAGDMEYACPMKRLDTAGLKERGDGAVPNGQDASCWTELLRRGRGFPRSISLPEPNPPFTPKYTSLHTHNRGYCVGQAAYTYIQAARVVMCGSIYPHK